MVWKSTLPLLIVVPMLYVQAAASEPTTSVDELLSYQCGQSVSSLVSPSEQQGPLFHQGHLLFTSIEAKDSSKILLVNAGNGNFVLTLEGTGVNRIRFELPTGELSGRKIFYLSYLHGGILRSRYFDFAEGAAPTGHDESDYAWVNVQRAENLLPYLDYAIHETAEATVEALTEGKLVRNQLLRHKVENCEHISRREPRLARNLKYNLDLLDTIILGPRGPRGQSDRRPASLGSALEINKSRPKARHK